MFLVSSHHSRGPSADCSLANPAFRSAFGGALETWARLPSCSLRRCPIFPVTQAAQESACSQETRTNCNQLYTRTPCARLISFVQLLLPTAHFRIAERDLFISWHVKRLRVSIVKTCFTPLYGVDHTMLLKRGHPVEDAWSRL